MKLASDSSSRSAWLPLQELDPAPKLLAAFAFAVLVSALRTPAAAAAASLPPLCIALAGRLPMRDLFRRLVPVNLFFLFLWLFLPLSLDRNAIDIIFQIGPLAFRRAGAVLALVITLKGNAIALAVLVLAGTSGINASGHVLLRLRLPAKLVTLILLTYSNIQLMRREAARLHEAAKLRGFTPATSLKAYRTYAYLAAMLLIRSWERAERVALAMRLRGFCGKFPLLESNEHLSEHRLKGMLLAGGICLFGVILLAADKVFSL